ncbi:MAG: glutathione synthase, partial [Rhodobacteraceae bacterium]|nr:glutathione synthase [Paracoccaceae bacterium]
RFTDEADVNLNDMDVVWLRQDPPFDMSYITTTHLLEMLDPATLVFNNPFWVRNCPEKLAVLNHADLMPPTMIARTRSAIDAFRNLHRDIILKPLYGNGGAGIFRLGPDDQNINALLELVLAESGLPVIVQKFIPAIEEGDKRIILVDGRPVGAINRLPPPDDVRANIHVGGRAVPADLTEGDHAICDRLAADLRQKGLLFAGIDVIGGLLTEINITSPTGIVELETFTGINAAEALWVEIEARHARMSTGG